MEGNKMEDVNPEIEYAEELAEELMSCGHEDISSLDILDALASTGLKLTSVLGSESSDAYIEALGVKVVS